AALAAVEAAVVNCTATGSETLTILATSAKIATVIEGVAGGDIQSWLNGNPDFSAVNAQSLEAIGESVVAMQPIACGKGGQFEGTEVCDNLNNAITNGTDVSSIAQQFLDQLSQAND
ncbi:MAG: hypothetical protein IT287_08440, partial [Bdellovibrionaceae bacterium]|nr:hypothetical protein [Pseudobdellovibrionaceae bacterium]